MMNFTRAFLIQKIPISIFHMFDKITDHIFIFPSVDKSMIHSIQFCRKKKKTLSFNELRLCVRYEW